MTAQSFLDFAIIFALAILSLSFVIIIARIIIGPTLPDRVLALDMLVGAAIGFIAVIGIKTGFTLYIDVAIALGLVGFLATVAFARFILVRGGGDKIDADERDLEIADLTVQEQAETLEKAGDKS